MKNCTKPTAKQYLSRVREEVLRLESMRSQRKVMEELLDGVNGIDYSKDRVKASSDGKVMERKVMAYIELQEKFDAQDAFVDMLIDQADGMLQSMVEAGLPEQIRSELELYYLWAYPSRDVARMCATTPNCVRVHRKRALDLADPFVPWDAA